MYILKKKHNVLVVVRILNKDESHDMFREEQKKNREGEREKGAYFSFSLLIFASSMFNIGTRSQSHKSTLNST